MELLHLLQLVNEIPQNTTLKYVRGNKQCEFVNVDIDGKRINSAIPNKESMSWAPSYLEDLAPKIYENEPFNLSGLLNNKGSYRTVLETIIAHTREFYIVKIGQATALVWIPSRPKAKLELEEIDENDIPAPKPHAENIQKINEIIFNPIADKEYSVEELGNHLKKMIASVEDGSKTSMFTLFGLKYGKYIDKATKILEAAGLPTNTHANSIGTGKQLYEFISERRLNMAFWSPNLSIIPNINPSKLPKNKDYSSYLAAMRTKPFLLLAGISGTGKSQIVKEMAFASCPPSLRQHKTSPGNYCMVEVKPNWHDSSELIGFVSSIPKPHYVVTPFINFLIKALHNPDVPFFVCLDEMNLAPVEQYFAEFLSVLESRKLDDGKIVSEPLIKADIFSKYYDDFKSSFFQEHQLINGLVPEEYAQLWKDMGDFGLQLPSNVIVVGTVNMDETTYQFSRKVIDRAMTIEMNEVDFDSMFDGKEDTLTYCDPHIGPECFLPKYTSAKKLLEVLDKPVRKDLKEKIPAVLKSLDDALTNTPFRIAYRVENELIIYFAELREEQPEANADELLAKAIDDILMMKVLPRIEGNEDVLTEPLKRLETFTVNTYPKAHAKIVEMQQRLEANHFTSFWP